MVKFGEEFITDLYKGYEAVLTRNYTQIADQLARGKYAIGIGWVLNSWQRYSGGTKDSEVST